MALGNSTVLRFLKGHQAFWDFVPLLARFYPMRRFEEIPREIMVETTNACNLRCPVCPTHFAMQRKKGFLDYALFAKVIDELRNEKAKPIISFEFAGEPIVNERIAEFVEYANRNGHETNICTNATVLTKELSAQLIRGGLSAIHLTLDGFSKEAHEAYRVGSEFDAVKHNIEAFLKIKQSLHSDTPKVVIQTLLTSFSENQVKAIVGWASGIGADTVRFKSLSMGSFTTGMMREKYAYLLPKKKEFLRRQSGLTKTLCATVLGQAVIYWNGDLGLCCIDFDNMCGMPNIKENGFIATWKSKAVLEKRRKGFLRQHSICRNCSLKSADYMGFTMKLK